MLSIHHLVLRLAFLAVASTPTVLLAKELPGTTSPTKQSDWNVADRQAWNTYRKDPIGGSIPGATGAARRFYEAFKVNLKAGVATEYENIMQRHAFYDAMSLTLHQATDVDKSLRCIRFFDAAADVTAATSLGGVEQLAGPLIAGFSDGTVQAILKINGMLFAKNVGVMKTLMQGKKPFDPLSPQSSASPSAMEFDLKMVQFEQGAIDDFLATRPELRTAKIIEEVSSPSTASQILGHYFSGQGGPTARWANLRQNWLPAVGITTFSFERLADRIALGEAYVFFLHRYDVSDFKAYRTSKAVPKPSCVGVIP